MNKAKRELKVVEVFRPGQIYIASKDFRFEADPLIDEGVKGEEFIFEGSNMGFARFISKKDRRKISLFKKEAFKIMRQEEEK